MVLLINMAITYLELRDGKKIVISKRNRHTMFIFVKQRFKI